MSFRRLIKKPREIKESVYEAQTFNYLFTLRSRGVFVWKNDEFPHPTNRQSHLRGLALDIVGVIKSQGGRHMEIEMKRPDELAFILKHWDRMKAYIGQNKKYQRFRKQIEHAEMVQAHGGIAMFASSWEQVRDRMVEEGVA